MSQTVAQDRNASQTETKLDVELRKVFKVYNGETAVRGIDLSIRQGEFFSILGPSGCGKTTTLRIIAGFEEPTGGEVYIRGELMTNVPPYKRPVNTVFQSYALFNHMTVADNIAFGLRIKNCSRSEVQQRVGEALQLVKMESFARRYPAQLSGGQQQRVALARALVNRPTVVLLDEPLGALDLKLRKEMQVELSNLHQELGVTFVMVTHDQEEALSLSDRIAVMNAGRLEQVGSPSEIYEMPQTPFVADFIGDTNLFQARVETIYPEMLQVVTDKGLRVMVKPQDAWQQNPPTDVMVSVRPEKIHVGSPNSGDLINASTNAYEGKLRHIMYLGTHVHYLVELATGDRITVLLPNRSDRPLDLHSSVKVYWSAADCLALPA
ncbi:ABC transporter ATP-binding protein [Leptolyngbya sp. FACHB-711]|uniref:ABC transporter ATP-binding protein n=1 Tax=unclassified Leptolyngbya TaxID=2650499 RepID=UPI001684DAF9|nr:ABC transporter ATP-binding protein [Leptolyngbya sp. FACHB-711]MBD1851083.1 ABC transporter ATP-binding protein [Cyanobacteria bacterium FACHB-502]MBD2025059.1 ABC transporter ATP-binding protein [Leptolyngbya sp. FACHB-711]